jgi:membrane-bound metal-dependent hydrolase YbcI (DUF457 family)
MFAIGHFALGYLSGRISSGFLKLKLNLPLLLVASVIPDVDLILQFLDPALFMHRGPSHSIVALTLLAVPFFVVYRKRAIPYYVALLSHSLLGDYFTGGLEMFWPLSTEWFGVYVSVNSLFSILAELVLFAVALAFMVKSGDLRSLFKPNFANLFLVVAFMAVLGPLLQIGGAYEASLPILLIVPSLFWLALFAYSIRVEIRHRLRVGV